MAMATAGIIPFHTAAILVMGENIGTSLTAFVASVGMSTNAKRAAYAHALFNIIGVVIIFPILPSYLELVEYIIPGQSNQIGDSGLRPYMGSHIAASHTLFNLSATLLFLPFLKTFTTLVSRITPNNDDLTKNKLILVGNIEGIVPASAITQAYHEVKKMKSLLDRMFLGTKDFLCRKGEEWKSKSLHYEEVTDKIQKEMTVFLCKVMEKPLNERQTKQVQALIKIVDEFESIADYLDRIVQYQFRQGSDEIFSSEKVSSEYLDYMDKTWDFFQLCCYGLLSDREFSIQEIRRINEQLSVWGDDIRDRHLQRLSEGEYGPLSALTYSDMVVALRKIRAHSYNMANAVVLYRK